MKIVGVIPARYASTRFPGKPLVDLKGKTMIQRVVEQCQQANCLSEVVVATDDARIFDTVTQFGGKAIMTSSEHSSGTERCAEAVSKLDIDYDFCINIQGDEPLINPEQIEKVGSLLIAQNAQLATLARIITEPEVIDSHNVVKVVTTQNQNALYFSRSIIPFERNERKVPVLQHIGIYGYSTTVLKEIVNLSPTPLEQTESLEQLRWLENGYQIKVGLSNLPTIAIDSPEDVATVLKLIENE